MASTRVIVGTVVTAAVLSLGVACSSSSSGDGSSGTSGGAGTSGGTSSNGLKDCNAESSSSSTCTAAETKTYSDCINDKCGAKFTECYGPGYKTGDFSGPCGTYIKCTQACPCNDTACFQKCGTPDAACTTCIQGVGTCSSACTAPACMTSGSSSSSSGSSGSVAHSCADLKACCDKIADPDKQTECNQTYSAVKASEPSCSAIYSTYAPQCP
jgi:hypothetical protein